MALPTKTKLDIAYIVSFILIVVGAFSLPSVLDVKTNLLLLGAFLTLVAINGVYTVLSKSLSNNDSENA